MTSSKHNTPAGSGRFSRRSFFKKSAMTGAATLSSGLFQALVARSALADDDCRHRGPGYGPLSPAGDELALPPGFHYSIVSTEGDMMDDGYPVPKAMDGMAAFELPNGNILLIRNHEDNEPGSRLRPRPPGSTSTSAGILNSILNTHYGPRAFAYDEFAGGGTTSIEVESHHKRRVVRQYWSLVGTLRNCAGGPTPWGSWLSCEETFEATSTTNFAQNHGYVFEVPVNARPRNLGAPVPLKQLGRIAHEAVAVDPATGIVYETEDQGNVSGFYRFVPATRPTQPGDLAAMGGRLEMLKVNAAPGYEAAIGQTVGTALDVSWALGQHLPDKPPAASPHCGANRHLSLSHSSARQQQISHVGAGDQQNKGHGAEKYQQSQAQIADQSFPQRHNCDLQRVTGLSEASQNRFQFHARLLDGNTRLQPPNNLTDKERFPPGSRQHLLYIEHSWQKHISFLNELKTGRHDADNLSAASVERQRLADDSRVAAEASLPESVTEDRHKRSSGPVLFRCERPPQLRCYAERRKQVGCHPQGIELLRFASSRQIYSPADESDQIGKRFRLCLPVNIFDVASLILD
jgi:Bacterial protein of unknown function (DUF839)